MKKLKKSKKASSYGNPSQAALEWYLAGIIDGEGCIAIQKSKQANQTNPIYSPKITVGMVNENIIKLLQENFGGRYTQERVPNSKNRQPVFRWRLGKKDQLTKVLNVLQGKLIEKENQRKLLVEFLSNKIENPNHKNYLCKEELQRRERLYKKSREFNAVGAGATTKRFDNREIEAIV